MRTMKKRCLGIMLVFLVVGELTSMGNAMVLEKRREHHEYHVSIRGDNANLGTADRPLRTISAAARLAQPGDVITVHQGVYREQIVPPRGGTSDLKRITYQAAPGETVTIKGSEVIRGWKKVKNDTWRVVLPNKFFGNFNPYADLIHGDWFAPRNRKHHTGAVYLNGDWLVEAARLGAVLQPVKKTPLWFGQVDADHTTIYAQFRGVDPNQKQVEINVRQSLFYPDKPGRNYITVRGFTMEHAATPWAPPTAEQIGLIGTHWSKGWVIEKNTIRYSTCVGVTLGKYGDKWDNTSQNTARGYVETIERALAHGWSKEKIGHHIVRNNTISHCEQAGIVGSLGAIFSKIQNNEVHDIHVRQLFGGSEQAGIKIHAAIDTEISGNHIYRTNRGIWLDWMAQGTRVTRNILHDNGNNRNADLYVEVNHGPFLVDHNFFLSPFSIKDRSEGGAYAHNLFAGKILLRPVLGRSTPFHPAHTTKVAGILRVEGGDDRFINNLFVGKGAGLAPYDKATHPVWMEGNVFLDGAKPSKEEKEKFVQASFRPQIKTSQKPDEFYLEITLDGAWRKARNRTLVTSQRLGKSRVPKLPYVKPDGSPYRLDRDYFGNQRNKKSPFPGPLEWQGKDRRTMKVWR